MTKIVITESQLKKLTKNLNENYVDLNDTYEEECKVDIHDYGLKFRGYEINTIVTPNITVTFQIDMHVKSYGITDISVVNVKGPSEIQLEIHYYGKDDEDDSDMEETITIPINWENVDMQQDDTLGWIGVNNNIQIDLVNNENGELVVDGIIVNYNASI
jgi:hypothetical protein